MKKTTKNTAKKTTKKPAAKVAKKATKAAAKFTNPYKVGGGYHASVGALKSLGMGKVHPLAKIVPAVREAMGDAYAAFEAKDAATVDQRIVTNVQVTSRKDYGKKLVDAGFVVRWDGRAKTAGLFKI